MRLKSEIFVSALTRRVFGLGHSAAVLRKGAADAGAIFIRQRRRSGRETLFGPAPQSYIETDNPAGRLFEVRLHDVAGWHVDAAIDREIRFDSDCWVVEIEVETTDGLFDVAGDRAG